MQSEAIWKPIKRPELGLMDRLSELVCQLEADQQNLLTSTRLGPTIILVCDYSGQHRLARYECYSFLLADLVYLWLWDEMRKEVRNKYMPDFRRMSFKNLNDLHRQKALVPFLRAANCIPGLLFSVIIDKIISSLFEKTGKLDMSSTKYDNYKEWKPAVFEKLLRTAHFGALLIGCMSGPYQNVLWFSDEDDIAANKERLIKLTKILFHHCNHYLSHNLCHFRFGTTKSDNGDRMLEDLVAITDLAAGALCEMGSVISHSKSNEPPKANESTIQGKTELIMNWLSEPIHTLKRLVVKIENNEKGEILLSCHRFHSFNPESRFFWHKDFIKHFGHDTFLKKK